MLVKKLKRTKLAAAQLEFKFIISIENGKKIETVSSSSIRAN